MENKATLRKHQRDWEELAALDPCWAVLSDESRKHGKWDVEEFFLTGRLEVEKVMKESEDLGYPVSRSRVLDFGCGMGRLTRAFAVSFENCHGVDISEEMIEKAQVLNGSETACQFHVNSSDNLELFPDCYFDMIYTNIVLQHIPGKDLIKAYIAEFLRVLRDDGLLVFQLPASLSLAKKIRCSTRRGLYRFCRGIGINSRFIFEKAGLHPIRMNCISAEELTEFMTSKGGSVLRTWSVPEKDSGGRFVSNTYFVTKPPTNPGSIRP